MTKHELLIFSTAADREALACDARTRTDIVAELTALELAGERARPPMTVVFTLDVSGSMSGAKLEHVIQSTERLVDLLGPRDRAGVITFSDRAETVSPVVALDDHGKQRLKRAVRRLRPLGGTNMEVGLVAAAGILPRREVHERQVLLLLSDGRPNGGALEPAELAARARALRPEITTATLGYGSDHDEQLLATIAAAGGGSYHYISNPELCQVELARALGSQGDIIVDSIELSFVPADGVVIERVLNPAETRYGAHGLAIVVPDMIAGARRLVAVQAATDPRRELSLRKIADVILEYRVASSGERVRAVRAVELPIARELGELCVPVHHQALVVRADEARARARALADRGNFADAAAHLASFIAGCERAPGYVAGDGSALSEAVEQLRDDAALYVSGPSADEYRGFLRGQRGDMAGDGAVARAHAAQSAGSRALAEASAGPLPPARLVLLTGPEHGRVFPLAASNVIGRTLSADIVVTSSKVSRRHTSVFAADGQFWVQCMGSTNGTYVNGARVSAQRLAPGDRIEVGDCAFRYET